ncbi:50S ribosomal protein L14e [Candidatus Woesearchaeota archaeon]|nr:50S ribosomal protein L14e [Candidatus Woesearchaeota archaeon]
MIQVGTLCMKIAGREAGMMCVVVDMVDKKKVLVDGQVRRRNCAITHIEPVGKVLEIKKGASHADVVAALKKEGIEVKETKPKQKKVQEKPEAKEAKKEEKPKKVVKKVKKK